MTLNKKYLLATAIVCTQLFFSATAQSAYNKLVWSDEFDKPGVPDTTKWTHEIGRGCPNNCGWGNNELEYYTNRKENAWVEDGKLIIEAKKEKFEDADYTSARLVSRGKFDVTYGRVEVRAKIPAGTGTWPAIWMLGSNVSTVGWPQCGEIDIMEHVGREHNKIYGTLHYPEKHGATPDGNTTMLDSATLKFHIYTLDWSPEAIKIFVDNRLFHTVTNSQKLPFNNNFFLILNVAMGGNFAGVMDPSITKAKMEVDYVRVYK